MLSKSFTSAQLAMQQVFSNESDASLQHQSLGE